RIKRERENERARKRDALKISSCDRLRSQTAVVVQVDERPLQSIGALEDQPFASGAFLGEVEPGRLQFSERGVGGWGDDGGAGVDRFLDDAIESFAVHAPDFIG